VTSYLDVARQSEERGNRAGRDRWDLYAAHRERLTAAILELAPAGGGGSLALLGAGNAHDVDLDRLAEHWREIHLVDIDAAALARARERASPAARARLRTRAPIDLSGLYHVIGTRSRRLRSEEEIDALVDEHATELAGKLPGVDVAVSCCVITQMSWGLQRALKDDRPLLFAFERAMLRIHLRTLAAMTAPGGTALLVTDFLSSRNYPLEEQAAAGTDLKEIVESLAGSEQAYRAANPTAIKLLLRRDKALSESFDRPRMGEPWLWTVAPQVTYLVYALLLPRRP
jgi:hypothetical protein